VFEKGFASVLTFMAWKGIFSAGSWVYYICKELHIIGMVNLGVSS